MINGRINKKKISPATQMYILFRLSIFTLFVKSWIILSLWAIIEVKMFRRELKNTRHLKLVQ